MLKIFNTLTRKKDFFFSVCSKKINMYVCGITVYDSCHIGHGRTFTIFDVILKYFKHCQYKVKYVRNITDIDDKIIQKSRINKENIYSLTQRMISNMLYDFKKLGITLPQYQPRATNHINTIIYMIEKLLKNKHAYIAKNGDVVFSISSYLNYGSFSNQSLKKLKYFNNIDLSNIKRDRKDFILWKKQVCLDDPCWKSPWGYGRPGWHIECSAINYDYFLNNIDIHGGGIDLLFPHHENERAQSICFHNTQYGHFWIHVGMLLVKNKKMSKSLNNALILKKILKIYNSEVVRYFFLSTHYRSPLYYSQENLEKSKNALIKLYFILYTSMLKDKVLTTNILYQYNNKFSIYFYSALNDDFNIPKALSILFQLERKIQFYLKYDNVILANQLAYQLKYLANIIGLLDQDPINFLNQCHFFCTSYSLQQHDNYIIDIIRKRNIARKYKLWEKADKLRDKLYALNVIFQDTKDGTLWKNRYF
ncbi:cysteine--tRNA ligase [Buchnera aphidicola]|uniref:cysteine--tRNA ligase n=1 Tax=Buchnera aphidicola TaxID=9 RepID=UPI002238BBED|nr:cysteine--tRNA ligase [Buchnera aphidicola (Stegophylla sp.)]